MGEIEEGGDFPTATPIKRAAMVFATWFAASLGADMESVQKALWFMESRFRGEVSLDELSRAAGISRYHFAHVFARATGLSAMRYMRGRRLSEAARVLANGGPDILSIALDFGYGSHEAFTRAFRDQFGITPESGRAQRHLENVNLVEAGVARRRLAHACYQAADFLEARTHCERALDTCDADCDRETQERFHDATGPSVMAVLAATS